MPMINPVEEKYKLFQTNSRKNILSSYIQSKLNICQDYENSILNHFLYIDRLPGTNFHLSQMQTFFLSLFI